LAIWSELRPASLAPPPVGSCPTFGLRGRAPPTTTGRHIGPSLGLSSRRNPFQPTSQGGLLPRPTADLHLGGGALADPGRWGSIRPGAFSPLWACFGLVCQHSADGPLGGWLISRDEAWRGKYGGAVECCLGMAWWGWRASAIYGPIGGVPVCRICWDRLSGREARPAGQNVEYRAVVGREGGEGGRYNSKPFPLSVSFRPEAANAEIHGVSTTYRGGLVLSRGKVRQASARIGPQPEYNGRHGRVVSLGPAAKKATGAFQMKWRPGPARFGYPSPSCLPVPVDATRWAEWGWGVRPRGGRVLCRFWRWRPACAASPTTPTAELVLAFDPADGNGRIRPRRYPRLRGGPVKLPNLYRGVTAALPAELAHRQLPDSRARGWVWLFDSPPRHVRRTGRSQTEPEKTAAGAFLQEAGVPTLRLVDRPQSLRKRRGASCRAYGPKRAWAERRSTARTSPPTIPAPPLEFRRGRPAVPPRNGPCPRLAAGRAGPVGADPCSDAAPRGSHVRRPGGDQQPRPRAPRPMRCGVPLQPTALS